MVAHVAIIRAFLVIAHVVRKNSSKDDEAGAEDGKDDKMLDEEKVVLLLHQDADAFRKDLEKLDEPQEMHRQFTQVMERLNQGKDNELRKNGNSEPV